MKCYTISEFCAAMIENHTISLRFQCFTVDLFSNVVQALLCKTHMVVSAW
jgi:hypothetical protein